jgi:hypothetical protein
VVLVVEPSAGSIVAARHFTAYCGQRAVTVAHLVQYPDGVDAFLSYHLVAQHKLMGAVIEQNGSESVSFLP